MDLPALFYVIISIYLPSIEVRCYWFSIVFDYDGIDDVLHDNQDGQQSAEAFFFADDAFDLHDFSIISFAGKDMLLCPLALHIFPLCVLSVRLI